MPDGLDEVEVDEEDELEPGDLEHGVVAQPRLGAAAELEGERWN